MLTVTPRIIFLGMKFLITTMTDVGIYPKQGPPSLRKIDTQRNQVPEDDRNRRSSRVGRWYKEAQRDPWQAKPHQPTGTWAQAEGGKGGPNGRGIRRKTQARGSGGRASGGGRQVAGVGDTQFYRVLF